MTAASQDRFLALFCFLAGYLVLRFLSAVFVPGGEWPLPPWHYVAMATDVALLAAVVGLRRRAVEGLAAGAWQRGLVSALLFCGIVAGVGLLAIRFTSKPAWWTGHLHSGLPWFQ